MVPQENKRISNTFTNGFKMSLVDKIKKPTEISYDQSTVLESDLVKTTMAKNIKQQPHYTDASFDQEVYQTNETPPF